MAVEAGERRRAVAVAVAGAAAVALAAAALLPRAWWLSTAGLAAAYVTTPVGKEAWIPLAEYVFGLPPWYAGLVVVGINALFCAGALALLRIERIPRLRARVDAFAERITRRGFRRPWMVALLAAAVALPFHSGGAVVGSVAGRLAGLTNLQAAVGVLGGVVVRTAAVVALTYGWLAVWP